MTPDELHILWKAILAEMELSVSSANFKTWFASTILVKVDRSSVTIGVVSQFTTDWIKKNFETKLLAIASRHLGHEVKKINFQMLPPSTIKKTKQIVEQPDNPSLFESPTNPEPQVSNPHAIADSNLNQRYTFETFIVGNKNRLAHAAALAVAEGKTTDYNPLYIYGGVGLGKTHLMQAVGNELIRRNANKKVVYVSCENFMNEFVTAISTGKKEEFKSRYRNVDLFLIDDIQFIAGKSGTQEEFFHTFNALYQKGKQIIMTSDKVPQEITGLEARLSSRFSQGMIADVQSPDLEMRQAILQAKCRDKKLDLSDEIITYVAEAVESNIRELEGALNTIQTNAMVNGLTEITIDDVRNCLRAVIKAEKKNRHLSWEAINDIVCRFYNVEINDVLGPRRNKEYVRPRQILMFLLKNELQMSFPVIGKHLGGRDHTTIMHGSMKIEKELKKNVDLFEEVKEIKELMYKA
jgi:chromosomal replication initiator protein